MKKWMVPITGLTATALLLGMAPATLADTAQALEVRMNNKTVNFPDAKPFVDANDRTMVPVRFIAEGMGAKVDWFSLLNMVVIQMNGKEITLRVGEDTATVNNVSTKLDTKTVMANDRTYVPLRFVSETLGANVQWDGAKNLVSISFTPSTTEPKPNPGTNPWDEPGPTDPIEIKGDLWGRPTRTTNLPKNAADFPYILANVPNEMYEMPYKTYDEPITTAKVLFTTEPQFTKENIDLWADRVKNHYQLILNVDYRTIDYSWADKLLDYTSDGVRPKNQYQNYVDWVKDNHIQVEGTIEPEASIMYHNWDGYNMRAKVKFRIVSFDQDKNVLYDVYYTKGKYKKGVWYTGYTDIALGTTIMGMWGPKLSVPNDTSMFNNMDIKQMN